MQWSKSGFENHETTDLPLLQVYCFTISWCYHEHSKHNNMKLRKLVWEMQLQNGNWSNETKNRHDKSIKPCILPHEYETFTAAWSGFKDISIQLGYITA